MSNTRFRIRFTKQGDLRWCSHRDLARAWERLLRRAQLDLALTEGFHTRPKISFPTALALGIESLEEYVDIELRDAPAPESVAQSIRSQTLDGMQILEVRQLAADEPKARIASTDIEVDVPVSEVEIIQNRIDQMVAAGQISFVRDGKPMATKLGTGSLELSLEFTRLRLTLFASPSATIRPSDVLEALGLADIQQQGAILQRTRIQIATDRSATNMEEDAIVSTSNDPI
jgi:radical SAM-linked protein